MPAYPYIHSHDSLYWSRSLATLNAGLIRLQSALATLLMIDDLAGIAIPTGLGRGAAIIGVVDSLITLNGAELRNPAADIRAIGIELLALEGGIEDAEVRLGIDADGGSEAPAAVVGGEVAVDQVLHEEALAEPPVQQQVLGQERRRYHPAPVVHVPLRPQLSHRRVH